MTWKLKWIFVILSFLKSLIFQSYSTLKILLFRKAILKVFDSQLKIEDCQETALRGLYFES